MAGFTPAYPGSHLRPITSTYRHPDRLPFYPPVHPSSRPFHERLGEVEKSVDQLREALQILVLPHIGSRGDKSLGMNSADVTDWQAQDGKKE